ATQVGMDRTVEVKQKQIHRVDQDIVVIGQENHAVFIDKNMYTEATTGGQVHTAKTGILLRVGDKSAIMLTPTAIVIDGPKAYVHPGADVMQAIYAGASAEAAVAAKQSAENINKGTQAILQADANRRDHGNTEADGQAQNRLWATARGANTPDA